MPVTQALPPVEPPRQMSSSSHHLGALHGFSEMGQQWQVWRDCGEGGDPFLAGLLPRALLHLLPTLGSFLVSGPPYNQKGESRN